MWLSSCRPNHAGSPERPFHVRQDVLLPHVAMELGFDGVLMNTAIAAADDSEKMALAMKYAIEAGRLAFLAGRMPKKLYASASSPLAGVVR